ncbi:GNAT family N-acetyltransferase [Natronococcus sp.]|uniref:GNAT family N-acetyltransferase n=1 Tax=Natronococcus sp. TaxID=35747 RepID=UPI003A4D20AC
MSDPYDVRRYEPSDRDAFLELFEEVLGGRMGTDWFAWKYEANPYVDHVPIVVAERDGELVGARSFFPLRVGAGDDRYDAFQPCDSMVHPDHQRRGLFTRMTERAIERYEDDVDLFFNFPNHRSLPGNLKLGWRVVGEQERYYRIQNPTAWLPALEPVESLARTVASGYGSFRDRLAGSRDAVERVRYDGVPTATLAALAGAETVPAFHVVRDEAFYEWRFENPLWRYRTVLATRGETVVAALVYGRRERADGPTTVRLVDVLPLAAGTEAYRTAILSGLLEDVVRANRDADVLVAPGSVIPGGTLRSRGFHSDQRPPLTWTTSASTHVVRPSGTEPTDWTLSGRRLTDASNWRLALCEVDSG